MVSARCKCESSLTPILGPFARHRGGERYIGAEPIDMNKALSSAIRQGNVISENDPGMSGLLFSTVRIKGSPPVRLRCRGSRTFEEIPPAELRAASKLVSETLHLETGTDDPSARLRTGPITIPMSASSRTMRRGRLQVGKLPFADKEQDRDHAAHP